MSSPDGFNDDNVPHYLKCPISHELMRDPVTARDGRTYERESIVEWLSNHSTSPFTRQKIRIEDLFTNLNIRDAVQDYIDEHTNNLEEEKNEPEADTLQYIPLAICEELFDYCQNSTEEACLRQMREEEQYAQRLAEDEQIRADEQYAQRLAEDFQIRADRQLAQSLYGNNDELHQELKAVRCMIRDAYIETQFANLVGSRRMRQVAKADRIVSEAKQFIVDKADRIASVIQCVNLLISSRIKRKFMLRSKVDSVNIAIKTYCNRADELKRQLEKAERDFENLD